jgi:ABC-type multidrug transport system fused ATPase/permease subunit
VHELNHVWLSRNVSVVSQEPTLYARSVRRNIIYGLEGTENEPSQEEIEEAARLANANSFIEVSLLSIGGLYIVLLCAFALTSCESCLATNDSAYHWAMNLK